MALLRASATVGGYTMASRVLGFARDILIANFLGAGPIADAFVVAFRIPNLFRRLVAEGAFTAAFVPLFARELEESGQDAALRFGNQALAMMFATLLVFTILAEITMPWVLYALAPGYVEDSEKFTLTVLFTRITFPYLLCMALVALLGGMLNAVFRFAAMSAAPVILNIVLITALVVGEFVFQKPGHALVWGVAVAGLAQLLWLIIACARSGLAVRLTLPRWNPAMKRLVRLMLPGVIGGGVTQINIVVGTAIATLVGEGAVAYLYYADRIYQLPLGVVGIALGTALLPLLSRQLRRGDDAGARDSINRTLEFAALLIIPATVALLIIADPIVAVLFGHGAFTDVDTRATGAALFAFSIGLPAYVLVKILSTSFFAHEDTVTPVRVAVIAMAVNVAASLLLIGPLGHVGVALATAIAAWLNSAMLGVLLVRRGGLQFDARLPHRLLRILLASTAMGLALWFLNQALTGPLGGVAWVRALALAALIGAGLAVYAAAAVGLGAAHLSDLKKQLRKPAA